MKFGHRLHLSRLVVLAILAGGVAGIASGAWPKTGVVLTVISVIGALIDHFNSQLRERDVNDIFEAQAVLLANTGIGNIYTETAKLQWKRGGSSQAIGRFKKALELNPNDVEALACLSAIFSIEASVAKWSKQNKGAGFVAKLRDGKAYAMHGKRIAPKDHRFYDSLGVFYDVEGAHELARSEFQESGKLRPDPYWHLLMATSWGMSGYHDKGLVEVHRAIDKGAKYWVVDFYYGRALHLIGDYEKAVPNLMKALAARKGHPQILSELVDAYYAQGQFGLAAKYGALCTFAILRWIPKTSIRYLGMTLHAFALYVATNLSRRVWLITKHVPLVKNIHMRISSPDEPEAALGRILMKRGHYELAERHLRKACETLPDSPYDLANLSGCLAIRGKRSEAIEKCNMAIRYARDKNLLDQLTHYKQDLESEAYQGPKQILDIDPRAHKVSRRLPIP